MSCGACLPTAVSSTAGSSTSRKRPMPSRGCCGSCSPTSEPAAGPRHLAIQYVEHGDERLSACPATPAVRRHHGALAGQPRPHRCDRLESPQTRLVPPPEQALSNGTPLLSRRRKELRSSVRVEPGLWLLRSVDHGDPIGRAGLKSRPQLPSRAHCCPAGVGDEVAVDDVADASLEAAD